MLTVIGKVNARLLAKLKTEDDAPYHEADLNFTSVSSGTPTAFPTLSVVSLGEPTAAGELIGTVQSAIWSTVELKAYTNTSLSEASELLDEAGDIMISMGYQPIYGQVALSDAEPFCKVARFRRLVADGDALY